MTTPWSLPLERVLEAAGSSRDGLHGSEARRRLTEVTPLATKAPHSVLRLLIAYFRSPIALLLLGAGVLSIAAGERVDGAIITSALLLSGLLGAWQEQRAGDVVAQLLARVRPTATVLRDGGAMEIRSVDVVRGDVLILSAGSGIAGDARLIESKNLFVNQSTLTGESLPAAKQSADLALDTPLVGRSNMLYAGTHVVSGTGRAIVWETGARTEYGRIAERLAARPPATEFEHGIRRFGYLLIEITLVLVIATFALNVARHRAVLDILLFSLALAVGLTPQLLPAIVGVTLARGAQRLARSHVIVRRLAAIEDLGGMEILCTDKTGTLTEGVMHVHQAEDVLGHPSPNTALLAYLNASFETGFRNPIDDALRTHPVTGIDGWSKVDEIPYDFERKRLAVVMREPAGREVLIEKGSVRSVLETCAHCETAPGILVPMDEMRAAIEERASALGREGFRCIAVASRVLPAGGPRRVTDERDLTLAGLVSFADPIKADARRALDDLRGLGVRTILITGDARAVAARIADEAGLSTSRVATGVDLDLLDAPGMRHVAETVDVFAEMEPRQKERVILALKQAGRGVGYLGDGINDAAALHAADVGISVASATAVTQQAADIVLLDKDLDVLAHGVREGRRAFANTLKYVFITSSANFGNMFSVAAASVFSPFLPLLPKQILITNVLTDLPAMTIATDAIDPELEARPRRWSNREIGRFLVAFGLISSAFDLLTFGALRMLRVDAPVFRTAWFVESILSELLILLVIRTPRPLHRSRPGRGLATMSVTVGLVTCSLPYTSVALPLGLAPLPPVVVGAIAAIVVAYTLTSDLTKRFVLRWAGDEHA